MPLDKYISKCENISLSMECFEDELSPAQMVAYEQSNERFNKVSETLNTISDRGTVLYENSMISIVYLSDSNSSQLLPDEISNNIEKNEKVFHRSNNEETKLPGILQQQVKFLRNYNLQAKDLMEDFTSRRPLDETLAHESGTLISQSERQKTFVNGEKISSTRLVIGVKPYNILTNVQQKTEIEEQLYLDENVTLVLSYSAAKFVEWLLKQGLLLTEQFCAKHGVRFESYLKMKFVDNSKFPCSGGYVWASDCCPYNYISIFKGSLFDGVPYSATSLVILLYHWSCVTDVVNVIKSLKISTDFLKNFYINLRGVCIAAIHEECKELLGGKNKMVEVGMISILRSKEEVQDKLQENMCILGILDSDKNIIKMHVIKIEDKNENSQPWANRYILHPLTKIINKSSIILTDFKLHRNFFTALGFCNVYQRPIQDRKKGIVYSNKRIMNYLGNFLPLMFENTTSLLNRTFIQQYLDELSWREKWGVTPLRAFNSVIDHIRKQAKLCPGLMLSTILSKIAHYPFLNWKYSNWKINIKKLHTSTKRPRDVNVHEDEDNALVVNRSLNIESLYMKINGLPKLYPGNYKPITCQFTSLESYYYGTAPGNDTLLELERKGVTLDVTCVLCGLNMKTNICVMNHLIQHAFGINTNSSYWCKYCIRLNSKFRNQYRNHPRNRLPYCSEGHSRPTLPNSRCLICEQDFKYRTKLILHMHFCHNELELPYECGICKFRSSQHHIVIDHFYKTHCNGEEVQCPLCLKVVVFKDNELLKTRNVHVFLNHLKKHCRNLVMKCNKCVLSFVNEGMLEYHQKTDHNSCKDNQSIQRYHNSSNVMMPLPAINSPAPDCNVKVLDLLRKCTYKELNIRITMGKPYENALCCECDGYMMDGKHLLGEFSCLLCYYKTLCEKSMLEHIIKFHSDHPIDVSENRKIILNKAMYCICGFKSIHGNKLANHLVKCGRKSAYNEI